MRELITKLSAKKTNSGQVAVILIVAIAIGFVLFAASINLTLMSQTKTVTMKAANAASSLMASTIASYGQKQWEETMGRRVVYCKKSRGGFLAILTLVVLIVIAVFAPEIAGFLVGSTSTAAGTFGGALQFAATASAVMQGASILIAATTDPGISAAWNKLQAAKLSETGQFVERGVMAGLESAVTDSGRIPDLYDMDKDGIFGFPGGNENVEPKDEISRLAYYVTKRLLELQGPDTTAVSNFLDALHEFVLKGNDGWGLWDPVYYPDEITPAVGVNPGHKCLATYFLPNSTVLNPAYDERPAECDPCCQQGDLTPDGCDASAGDLQIGNRLTCKDRTPFREVGKVYQYLYDPTYENSTNGWMSFREQLGRDDEHKDYHTNQNNPNWHADPVNQPQLPIVNPDPRGFFLRDTVGFYTAPGYILNRDQWVFPNPLAVNVESTYPKLFPFLYKMADWGPELKAQNFTQYECLWCSANKPSDPGLSCPADFSAEVAELPRFTLTADPTAAPYNNTQGYCVNSMKENKGGADDPPVAADKVRSIPDLIVADTDCAIKVPNPIGDMTQYIDGWKRGGDRFCSNSPGTDYDLGCAKYGGNPDAVCSVGTATQWPDDMFDDMIYNKMPELFDTEANLWKLNSSAEGRIALSQNIAQWYGEVIPGENFTGGISDWIEPPCANPNNCPGSFTKLPRPGVLWIWREQLFFVKKLIDVWLVPDGTSGHEAYSSADAWGPDAAWCVPQNDSRPGTPAEEQATFDSNGNGVRGDIKDVIECLRWNVEDSDPPLTGTGNAEKFLRCLSSCNSTNCSNLPRSLIPDFYTFLPFEFYPGDEAKFNACLTSGTIAQCNNNCDNTILPSGAPYNLPGFSAPDLNALTDIDDLCSLGPGPHLNACNGAIMPTTLWCSGANDNRAACRCSWANDCTLSNECSNTCGTAFCQAVLDSVLISRGTCGNARAADFFIALQQSADEAALQVDKFRQRLKFLEGRYKEAINISNMLGEAIDKITGFIDGGTPFAVNSNDSPSEKFIKAQFTANQDIVNDLPAFAIYVWQDKDPIRLNPAGQPRWGTGQGYWHAVKVEVRLPRRCTGDCGSTDWPKITSSTSGGFFKKKVCYRLVNLRGITKARVIRYDQDKDLTGLVFPGGGKIWQSRLSNPTVSGDPDPNGLRAACADLIDPKLAEWLGDSNKYGYHAGAAFMLNKVPDLSDLSDPYTACWLKVHNKMLAHGVMSESCSEYDYVDPEGFRVKFVPCDSW